MKQTPLYDIHKKLGARMAAFAGWEMPIYYSAISEEHRAVRERVGLFDISHMGELDVTGLRAAEAVRLLATNDPIRLKPGGCQYSLALNDAGGVRDDIIVSKRADDAFFICVNAGNTDKITAWAAERLNPICPVRNVSDSFGQLALQGPRAAAVGAAAFGQAIPSLAPFHFIEIDWHATPLLISRTGYTGEDGIEIYSPWDQTPRVWSALLESGRSEGILPVGLGARDTLRLEAALPLYGHELTEGTDPFEAGLGWVVKPKEAAFIGADALQKKGILQAGYHPVRRLAGFEMTEPGIARQGHAILFDRQAVGTVTSGTLSPTLDRAVGLAYLPWGLHTSGTEITIDIRGKLKKAKVVLTPFVKQAHPKGN